MRTGIIALLLLGVVTGSMGQTPSADSLRQSAFVRGDVELLIGKTLLPRRIWERGQKYGYFHFFPEYEPKAYRQFVPRMNYDSIVADTFLCTGVLGSQSTIEPIRYLQLVRDHLDTLYYEYDIRDSLACELETVGPIVRSQEFYCSKITRSVDKFNGDVTWRMPPEYDVQFLRRKTASISTVYLSLTSDHASVHDGQGVFLILDDGRKINKPSAQVEINVSPRATYVASAFIALTAAEVKTLMEHRITDYRLYTYDQTVEDGELSRAMLKCIVAAE